MQIGQQLPADAMDAPWNYGIRSSRLFSFVHKGGAGIFLGFFDSGHDYGAELRLDYNLHRVTFRILYAGSWGDWKIFATN